MDKDAQEMGVGGTVILLLVTAFVLWTLFA